jgi:hypothetical protein
MEFLINLKVTTEIFAKCEKSQKRRIMNSKIDSLKMREDFMFCFPAHFVRFVVNIDATFSCHTRRISNNIFSPVQLILSLRVFLLVVRNCETFSARSNIFLRCFYLHPPNSLLCLLLSKISFFVFLFSFVLIVGRCSSNIPLCVFFRAVLRILVQKI